MLYHLISPWPCCQNHLFVRGWSYMFLPSGIIFEKTMGHIGTSPFSIGKSSIWAIFHNHVELPGGTNWNTQQLILSTQSYITRFNPHGKASRASMISGYCNTPQEIYRLLIATKKKWVAGICWTDKPQPLGMTSGLWVVLWKVVTPVTLKSDGCGAWKTGPGQNLSPIHGIFGTHIAFSRDWTNLISSTVYNKYQQNMISC